MISNCQACISLSWRTLLCCIPDCTSLLVLFCVSTNLTHKRAAIWQTWPKKNTVKKWRAQENVISVALWIHLVLGSGPPLLLPWFRVTSLSQSSFLELGYKWNSFLNCIFLPKREWNSGHIHILLDELKYSYTIANLWVVFMIILLCNYSCRFGTLSAQRLAITILWKMWEVVLAKNCNWGDPS